jgi:hypothetical protein
VGLDREAAKRRHCRSRPPEHHTPPPRSNSFSVRIPIRRNARY